jgi:Cysteine-rich secretory protein family
LTNPNFPPSMRLSRTVSLFLILIAGLMAGPVLAEDVAPPAPPVVDTPPPPPLPVTIDPSEVRYVVARPVYAEPAPAPAAAQPVYQYQYGDPYGFTEWLNGVRAQNGRGPVGHDANLSAWASANNGQQLARGMGHHVMGAARRQNSGVGAAGTVWQMWMASPAHQAALLDPTITMIGIAASGSYWTFNAY